jgi:hypothetical protein
MKDFHEQVLSRTLAFDGKTLAEEIRKSSVTDTLKAFLVPLVTRGELHVVNHAKAVSEASA